MTIDKATGELIEPEYELTRQLALDLLNEGARQKDRKAEADAVLLRILGTNKKPGPLRQWANDHLDETLEDRETGACLERSEPASGGPELDVRSMARDEAEALLELARQGLLQLNGKAWDASDKNFREADVARRYLMPAPRTVKVEIKSRRK